MQVTQEAHIGYKAVLWKIVTENGKTEKTQINSSTYQAVPRYITKGAAKAKPKPSARPTEKPKATAKPKATTKPKVTPKAKATTKPQAAVAPAVEEPADSTEPTGQQ